MMKAWVFVGAAALLALGGGCRQWDLRETKRAAEVAALVEQANRVEAWQLAHLPKANPLDWTMGSLYTGLVAWGLSEPNRPGIAYVREIGREKGWGYNTRPTVYMADNHTVGQAWLDLAQIDGNPAAAEPFKALFDRIEANPSPQDMTFSMKTLDRWVWADALYMAPPVWARLAKRTGDEKYRAFMGREYRATVEKLFCPERGLFYRDSRYMPGEKLNPDGRPIFWSRGNGWVFAGLAMILRDLPAEHPDRAFYLDLFRTMAAGIQRVQQPDGSWYPNLAAPADNPCKEMSGTAFFVYGYLAGLNNGWLEEGNYAATMQKGWNALNACIDADGKIGFVQVIGQKPDDALSPDSTAVYAVGAYLSAAAEMKIRLQRMNSL